MSDRGTGVLDDDCAITGTLAIQSAATNVENTWDFSIAMNVSLNYSMESYRQG